MTEPDYILVIEDPGQTIVVSDTYIFAADNPVTGVVVVEMETAVVVSVGESGPRGAQGASGTAISPVSFSFGDASPASLYTASEDMLLDSVQLIVAIPFDGVGAALKIGKSGTLDAYMTVSQNDPATAATYETSPDVIITSGTTILLTITPGSGAGAGSGRVVLNLIPL